MISSNDFMRAYMINVGTAVCLWTNPLTPSPLLANLPRPFHSDSEGISSLGVWWFFFFFAALAVVRHIRVWQWLSLKWVILARLTAQRSGEDVPACCADRARALSSGREAGVVVAHMHAGAKLNTCIFRILCVAFCTQVKAGSSVFAHVSECAKICKK